MRLGCRSESLCVRQAVPRHQRSSGAEAFPGPRASEQGTGCPLNPNPFPRLPEKIPELSLGSKPMRLVFPQSWDQTCLPSPALTMMHQLPSQTLHACSKVGISGVQYFWGAALPVHTRCRSPGCRSIRPFLCSQFLHPPSSQLWAQKTSAPLPRSHSPDCPSGHSYSQARPRAQPLPLSHTSLPLGPARLLLVLLLHPLSLAVVRMFPGAGGGGLDPSLL